MHQRTTDFYLNLDRWETLSALERQRGLWEARLEGPAVRLDPVRRDAMTEAAWELCTLGGPLDRSKRDALVAPSPPDGSDPRLLRAWQYYRAMRFVHGWYPAFKWDETGVHQLARMLAAGEPPAADGPTEEEDGAEALLRLHRDSCELDRQSGNVAILDLAAYYGGFEQEAAIRASHVRLYLLGFRLRLLQAGYNQVLFAPVEAIWSRIHRVEHRSPVRRLGASDPDEQLGAWLDDMVQLVLAAGRRADELWSQARTITTRSDLQQEILTIALREGRVSAGEVIRTTRANRNTVKDNLARLVEEGMLHRQGAKRGTVYFPA